MQETQCIPGAAGMLEALVTEPQEQKPVAVAILCHPHPLHQGTMYNKVVTTLMKAFDRCGAATVRFNFRGVGQSMGVFDNAVGECDDLRAVITWVKQQYPGAPIWLAGFSFGAYVAARVANDDGVAGRLVSIAPAIDHYSFDDLNNIRCPWLVVHGDKDDVAPYAAVADWANTPPSPLKFITLEQAGHFFHGRLVELRELVITWLDDL